MTPRTRGPARVPGLDAVRACSALTLVLFHATIFSGPSRLDGGPLQAYATGSYLAVDVFFVLSGVLLFLPAAEHGTIGPLKDYYARRAARILPMYWFVVVLAMVFRVNPPEGHAILPPSAAGWRELLVHLSFLQTPVYGLDFRRQGLGFDGVLWTLSIEVTFYVLLPLFVRPFLRRPWLSILAALAVSRLWVYAGEHGLDAPRDQQHMVAQLPAYLFHFAIGMGVALALVRAREAGWGPRLHRRAGLLFGAGSLGVIGYFIAAGTRPNAEAPQLDTAATSPILVLSLGVLIFGVTALRGRPARWLAAGWIFALSDATYGLYLLHLPLMKALQDGYGAVPRGRPIDFLLLTSAAALALMAALVLARVYERPVRSLVNRRLARAPSEPRIHLVRPAHRTLPRPARVRAGVDVIVVRTILGTLSVAAMTILPLERPGGTSPTKDIWAEDGGIYLTGWLRHGAGSLLTPYNGYLHLTPRLLTWPTTVLPLQDAATSLALTATFVTALLAVVVWWASGQVLRSPSLRLLVAAALPLLPQTAYETTATLTDLHWALLVTTAWVLLAAPTGRRGQAMAVVLTVATAMSDPLAFLLLPVAWVGIRRRVDRRRAAVPVLAMLPCLAVQEAVHLTSGFMHAGATHVNDIPTIYAFRVLLSGLVGDDWLLDVGDGSVVLVAVALIWLVALLVLAARAGGTARRMALGLAFGSVALTCLPLLLRGTVGYLDHPLNINGSRYSIPGLQLLLAALVVLVDATPRWTRSGLSLLIVGGLVVQGVHGIGASSSRSFGPDWHEALLDAEVRCADTARVPDVAPILGGRRHGDDVPPTIGRTDVVLPIAPSSPSFPLLFGVVLSCRQLAAG